MITIQDCGLQLEPQFGMRVEEIIRWTKYAEKCGYGYLFRSDHLLPTNGFSGMRMDSPECWVTLGVMAACSSKIKFGTMVSPIGFRNPALLARMACTLHSYSGGRLLLGVGAGWYEDEYLAHGYDFPQLRIRIDQFREAISIIKALTEGKEVDFRGKYYSARTTCRPKPKGKVKLIVGGKNRELMKITAKYADEWNVFNPSLDAFIELKKFIDRNAERKIEVSMMGPFIISESKRELEPKMRYYWKSEGLPSGGRKSSEKLRRRGVLCGIVDEFISQLNELVEAGVQKFYFQLLNPKDKEMVDLLTASLKHGI